MVPYRPQNLAKEFENHQEGRVVGCRRNAGRRRDRNRGVKHHIDNGIANLRPRLAGCTGFRIVTVRGMGYKATFQ